MGEIEHVLVSPRARLRVRRVRLAEHAHVVLVVEVVGAVEGTRDRAHRLCNTIPGRQYSRDTVTTTTRDAAQGTHSYIATRPSHLTCSCHKTTACYSAFPSDEAGN